MSRNSLVFVGFLIAAVLSLSGCGGNAPALSVAVTATATTVDGNDTTTLTAAVTNDKNSAGVTWMLSGAGTLSNTTTTSATYTAPAPTGSAQSATITATSIAETTKSYPITLTIPAAPSVTSTSASLTGAVGTAYSIALQASGGIAPYTWALGNGTTLPACLTLKSSGVITTTSGLPPTASCAGTYSDLTFEVTDSGTPTALNSTSPALSITITAPTITFPASLPGANVGVVYSASVAATGPVGTTTYSLASGALPVSGDLVLNASTGAITGTPKAADAGTYNFTVNVTDQFGDTATSGALGINVTAPTITFPASLPNASVGTAYNASVAATGPVGTTTYSLASGALPVSGDLVLNTGTGAITGTPKAADAGTYPFTVKVTDQYADTATSGSLSLKVNAAPAITFGAAPTATATAGVAYSSSLSASGGAGSLTYSITSGALPTGLILTAGTGAIAGTPTGTATTYNFTAQAADNFGDTPATQAYSITLNPGSATHFVVAVTSSTTITAGGTVNFSVTAQDAYGNTATGYAGTAKFTSSDAKAVLPSPSGLTSGVGSFAATLETAGNQTVTATDTVTSTITGTSGGVTVNPGTAAKFLVSAPSAVTTAAQFSFTVTAEDSYNNTATSYAGTIHFTSSDGAAALPANSGLSNGAGSFQATLNTNGTQTITATDTVSGITGTSSNITVSTALIITTSSLNSLDIGQAPTQVLAASGGSGNTADYSWSWTAQGGSSIPPGLSLSTGGAIQGSPTTAGTYQVTVKVSDSGTSTNYSSNFSITIDPALSLPSPDPASLPSTAYVGYSYNSGNGGTVTGSGGSGNLSISVASGLPSDGLSGAGSGATLSVTGTPTSQATVTFGAKLTDSTTGYSITQNGYNITVNNAVAVTLPAPSGSIPGAATVGQSYSGSITASNGVAPYTWSINGTTVTSGGLSIGDGLTATSTGGSTLSISGTPTTAQTVTLTNVKVVDSESPTTNASNTYGIQVNNTGGQISGQISLNNTCNVSTLPTFTVTLNTTVPTQVQTNGSGQFTFNNITPGTYTITPSIPGATSSIFYPASYTGVVVTNSTNLSSENFNAVVGYTVSGSVSYSGSQTGQTYLYLENNNCGGGQGNPGTSITESTLTTGDGVYSIRGVPPGSYTLYAQMDSTGITSGTDYPGSQGQPNTNNPVGSNSSVSVTNASVSNVSVTLANATYATPPSNPSIQVIPTVGGALIFYNPPTVNTSNGNQEEAANEYVVNWAKVTSTDSDGSYCPLGGGTDGYQFGTVAGSHTFYAVGNGATVWILDNTSMGSGSFTSGGKYCFQTRAFNTLAGTTHPTGWTTPTDGDSNPQGVTLLTSPSFCSTNCTTVSGAVTIPAGVTIATGAPLYVGAYQNSSSGNGPSAIYAYEIASPTTGANNYSMTIPNGSGYVLFGILDQNNDGAIDAYDVTNVRNNNSNGVTFSGGTVTGQSVTLPGTNSTVQVQTQYSTNNCSGCTPSYYVNMQVYAANKLPVAVTLSSTTATTPYVMTPVDIGVCVSCGNTQFSYYASLPSGTPSVGDSFDFTVIYSNGSQDSGTTVNGAVGAFGSTGALVGAADVVTNQQTAGTNPLEPNFTWTFPANPSDYVYQFNLSQNSNCSGNCTIWEIPGQNSNSNGFTYAQTETGAATGQITWGTDPTGGGSTPSGSLNASDDYGWSITVQDSNGNQATSTVSDNLP